MNLFLSALLKHELLKTDVFEQQIKSMPEIAKRYREIENSEKLKEYHMLDTMVTTDFFQTKKKKALQEKNGKQAWLRSEDGQQEQRYEELKKDADILFFQKTNVKDVERVERLVPVMDDDCNWTKFESSDWKAGFVYPNDSFQKIHSYTNELQAYGKGDNVDAQDSIMRIHTRKEFKNAPAWDAEKGMIMHDFDYTSDIINNGIEMSRDGGLVMIKARCRGYVNHGAYLRSPKHLPLISIFDYTGFKMYCGLKTKNEPKEGWHLLKGFQPIPYVIFTVYWDKTDIIWFVNNMPVYRHANTLPAGEKLYLHLYSCLFKNQRRKGEGSLDIDWVKQYKFK